MEDTCTWEGYFIFFLFSYYPNMEGKFLKFSYHFISLNFYFLWIFFYLHYFYTNQTDPKKHTLARARARAHTHIHTLTITPNFGLEADWTMMLYFRKLFDKLLIKLTLWKQIPTLKAAQDGNLIGFIYNACWSYYNRKDFYS